MMIMAIIPSVIQTCSRSLNGSDKGSFVTRLKLRSELSLQTAMAHKRGVITCSGYSVLARSRN